MGHLYLTGISGSGKTTIGRILAERWKVPFYDVDETIEQTYQSSIQKIVQNYGWIQFRLRERQVLLHLSRQLSGVVALGGSTILYPNNYALVRNSGKLLYLQVSPSVIAQRVFQSNKLRFLECDTFQETFHTAQMLHRERNALFSQSDFIITIQDEKESAEQTVQRILNLVGNELDGLFSSNFDLLKRTSSEHTLHHHTEYYWCDGGLKDVVFQLLERLQPSTVFIITDETVDALYSSVLLQSIPKSVFSKKIVVPSGESSKSWEIVDRSITDILQRPMDRNSLFIGLGGGVVTDLCGFIASILLRGIPWVAIPTTIIGMVDAAIGGKTAINVPLGKNLVGTFHPPIAVVFDRSLATTLSLKEIQCGWGEVIKYGLLSGGSLWNSIKDSDFTTLPNAEILAQCFEYKRTIVELDLLEKGERKYLNLGHTSGHALESALGFQQLSHGEAVLWGLGVVAKLSKLLRSFPEHEYDEVRSILSKFALPAVDCEVEDLFKFLQYDKKNLGGVSRWILLDTIGKPIFDCPIPVETVTPILIEHSHFLRLGKVIQ
ncbi:MAG: bifunctional shikimate kinase/3-dehydroquinate synthase [bacterium]|nr:bifunctional shikimate kinase/3-dehydroquinate synthase [bacterium]